MEALETIIETFISDLHYYKLAAKKYFTFTDVCNFLERHISLPNRQGKIGQKAAGMILAYKIIQTELKEFADKIRYPESYYLTTDVFFECMSSHTYNFSSFRHRLKEGTITEEELEKEYPYVRKLILETVMPDLIRIKLGEILKKIGHKPIIVRSSSLLEDSASAFSGKYDSYFFANQKLSDYPDEDLEKRLDVVIGKIFMVYASALRPEALIYRRERGLLDIDERMSVLIQIVEGNRYGKYFFPALAGVGLSYNNKVNIGKIKWNDPVLRIGVGLGTGIVDMNGYKIKVVYPQNPDYSNIINYHEIFKSSQRKFDLLNLETDTVESVTKSELFEYFNENKNIYPEIKKCISTMGRYFLSTAHLDYYTDGIGLAASLENMKHIISFEGLKKTGFYKMTNSMLKILADKYNPADMEFTLDFSLPRDKIGGISVPDYELAIVQCRQLTGLSEDSFFEMLTGLSEENIVCRVQKSVVSGYAPNVEYIVYVDVDKYYELEEKRMYSVARAIGKVNHNLHGKRFVLIGPGRWGSSMPYHGIKVSYTEIYHTLALVEVARKLWDENFTEPSLGSHFGNDVRESRIINFSITPGSEGTKFDKELFRECPNSIDDFIQGQSVESWVRDVLKVIDTKNLPSDLEDKSRQYLHIISNVEQQVCLMFLGEKRAVKKFHMADPRRSVEEAQE
ncbi:PEP/pyruvate-binding domain-containing protein [candidate division KSB1 bacterium]